MVVGGPEESSGVPSTYYLQTSEIRARSQKGGGGGGRYK